MTSPLYSAFLVINLIVIQLLGAYLRYLPFRQKMTTAETKTLWKRFFVVSTLLFAVDMFIFQYYGISPFFYKLTFVLAFSSYFLIAVLTIKEKFLYHIFAFGLQTIWALILQAMAAIVNDFCKHFFSTNEIFLQGIFFLIFFAIFWKIEQNFFSNLFSPQFFFKKYFKWYDALLPTIIFIGFFVQIMDDVLIHPLLERTVRFFMPILFFAMYRSINIFHRQLEKKNRQKSFNIILHYQLCNLREYDAIIQENQKKISILRHDLRHNYRLITAMLKAGKIQKAIEHLQTQIQLLQIKSQKLETQSIIQSLISTYQNKAKDFGIKMNIEIKSQSAIFFNESDLAILISNLLENAITAEKNQPPNAREIFLKLYQNADKNFLEIYNLVNFNFAPGNDEIPFKKRGTGMNTLLKFKKEYDAQIKFSQLAGWLKISVSWKISP